MNAFRISKTKYKACKTHGFPSKLEYEVFRILVGREANGEISEIRRQQKVTLQDGDKDEFIDWKVDFSFIEKATGKKIYCEAKGIETADYKLKLRMWRKQRPYKLEIWKGNYRKRRGESVCIPFLFAVIEKEKPQ